MICPPCCEDTHDACRGGSWCDCGHGGRYRVMTKAERDYHAVVTMTRPLTEPVSPPPIRISTNGTQEDRP